MLLAGKEWFTPKLGNMNSILCTLGLTPINIASLRV